MRSLTVLGLGGDGATSSTTRASASVAGGAMPTVQLRSASCSRSSDGSCFSTTSAWLELG